MHSTLLLFNASSSKRLMIGNINQYSRHDTHKILTVQVYLKLDIPCLCGFLFVRFSSLLDDVLNSGDLDGAIENIENVVSMWNT